MDKINIEQALIASAKDKTNSVFTKRVMTSISKNKVVEPHNRKSFFNKIWHLPRYAIIAMAVLLTALASGTAYAAYQLWLAPSAQITSSSQNQYNRKEVVVGFQNCGKTASAKYEVKSGNLLSDTEVAHLLQARCEILTITNWANKQWESNTPTKSVNVSAESFAVTKISDNTIDASSDSFSTTLQFTSSTKFIVNGLETDANAIKPGDNILYVELDSYASASGGSPTKRELMAVIKLELPAIAYSTSRQYMVAERQVCYGNTGESCVLGASIDVYPRDGENNLAPTAPGDPYEIQGEIVSHNGNNFELKASSGAIYSIAAPIDAVTEFNAKYSGNYEGARIELGDKLLVRYSQNENDDHKVVLSEQVQSIVLLIELAEKTDPLKKY